MFNAAKTAETLEVILRRHGLSPDVRFSSLSSSRYMTVDGLRIRVSDHVAKPTYEATNGVAHFEIGNHDMASTVSPVQAAGIILNKLGVEHDRYLRAALGRMASEARKFDEAAAKQEAMRTEQAQKFRTYKASFEEWAGERLNLDGLNAKQRKRRRQALRAQFTKETGTERVW